MLSIKQISSWLLTPGYLDNLSITMQFSYLTMNILTQCQTYNWPWTTDNSTTDIYHVLVTTLFPLNLHEAETQNWSFSNPWNAFHYASHRKLQFFNMRVPITRNKPQLLKVYSCFWLPLLCGPVRFAIHVQFSSYKKQNLHTLLHKPTFFENN